MSALLEVENLNSYYGDSHILFDVSLHVAKNEVVALLGRNGAGKSTTFKSLIGMVRPRSGRVVLEGREVQALKSHAIALHGLQLVPEERRIFGSLSVEENLILAGLTAESRWPLDRVWEIFPRLRERRRSRGTDLSGGEQQMLAIARALVRDPKIILLDEPFEGLAPIIVRDLLATCRTLAEAGQTLVVVEQNVSAAMTLADRVYIINNGHIVETMTAQAVRAEPEVLHRHLGVQPAAVRGSAAALCRSLVADRLRKDGLNSVDRRRVAIVDMEALQRLGQFQPLIPAPMEEAGT